MNNRESTITVSKQQHQQRRSLHRYKVWRFPVRTIQKKLISITNRLQYSCNRCCCCYGRSSSSSSVTKYLLTALVLVTLFVFILIVTVSLLLRYQLLFYSVPLASYIVKSNTNKRWNIFSNTIGTSITTIRPTQYQCAPWLLHGKKQRIVAFIDLATMDNYYNTKKKIYRGGEFYMSASLDYALQENDFIVERIGIKSILDIIQKSSSSSSNQKHMLNTLFSKYYRIFTNGYDPWLQILRVWNNQNTTTIGTGSNVRDSNDMTSLLSHENLCKIRSIHWWGNTNQHTILVKDLSLYNNNNQNHQPAIATTRTTIDELLPFLHTKQWIKPYPTADYTNTFIGYFPHSSILYPHQQQYRNSNSMRTTPTTTITTSNKVGLLFGKYLKSFRMAKNVIDALVKDGFELHTTCKDCNDDYTVLSKQVIRHSNIGPKEFIDLLQNYNISFLLGLGYPYDSPSPIEALANGIAFINPIVVGALPNNETIFPFQYVSDTTTTNTPPRSSQHTPIQMLGIPYVYNVHLNNIQQVVDVANRAVQNRFISYIPYEYHPLSHVARVCSTILEDNSICTCSPTTTTDCHSSSTVRKPTTGSDANGVGNISFY